MHICPVCGKALESKFALNGHLRLSTNSQHVSYTGKITSRKHVREVPANPSKQTDVILLEFLSRLEAKLDALNKPQQQPVKETKTLAITHIHNQVEQPKPTNWRDYVRTVEPLTRRSVYLPNDEYLNSLVESGFSPEYVRDRAEGKGFKSKLDDDED